MTKLARFLFGHDAAETILTRTIGGQHWYMAYDICNLLGITNHSAAVHGERTDYLELDDDEWCKRKEYTGTSNRRILLVNDIGMLKLVFQGKSDRAREVQELARNTPERLRTGDIGIWLSWHEHKENGNTQEPEIEVDGSTVEQQ